MSNHNPLEKLSNIAEAYMANNLDAEARRFWGSENQFENNVPAAQIVLYCTRGGMTLLTLQDCIDAKELIDKVKKWPVYTGPKFDR